MLTHCYMAAVNPELGMTLAPSETESCLCTAEAGCLNWASESTIVLKNQE